MGTRRAQHLSRPRRALFWRPDRNGVRREYLAAPPLQQPRSGAALLLCALRGLQRFCSSSSPRKNNVRHAVRWRIVRPRRRPAIGSNQHSQLLIMRGAVPFGPACVLAALDRATPVIGGPRPTTPTRAFGDRGASRRPASPSAHLWLACTALSARKQTRQRRQSLRESF